MYGFLGCHGNRLFKHLFFCPIVCCPVPQKQQPQPQPQPQQQAPFKGGKG